MSSTFSSVNTTQQGCSVLPKSVTPTRIEENLRVVKLTDDHVEAIAKATEGMRMRYCDFSDISEFICASELYGANAAVGYKYYADLDDNN